MNKDSIKNQTIANCQNADSNNILAPFNPTNAQAQHLALDLLSLQKDDVLFDLGCGDARMLIAAVAQIPGLRCVGVEIDPRYHRKANDAIASYRSEHSHSDDGNGTTNIGHRIHIHLGDALSLFDNYDGSIRQSGNLQENDRVGGADEEECGGNDDEVLTSHISQLTLIQDATCVFLYLLPEGLEKIKPLLERCFTRDGGAISNAANKSDRYDQSMGLERNKGEDDHWGSRRNVFRVVSYMFRIPGWTPVAMREHAGGCCKIYLYDKTSLSNAEVEGELGFIEMVHP